MMFLPTQVEMMSSCIPSKLETPKAVAVKFLRFISMPSCTRLRVFYAQRFFVLDSPWIR